LPRIEEILKGIETDDDLRGFLKESRILSDELSLELIRRIGGLNSPLSITSLPIPNFQRDLALARLYELEKLHIFESELEKKGDDYIRVFKATDLGRRLAQTIRTNKSKE